ncbi:MAG: hypothetical protein WKF34_13335 [Pyrinomonadaceae bacterium]
MVTIFQLVAVIFAIAAAYFWWSGNSDGLFVAAVLGAVAFFLTIRFQVKDRLKTREIERLAREEGD